MNNESPLIPQGSFLEQKNRGRARVRIAVFVVLAIHGIGLMALLMQGCKPNVPTTEEVYTDTNVLVAPFEPTNEPLLPEPVAPVVTETSMPPIVEPPVTPPPEVTAPTTTEYKIVAGDTFSGLAKKFNVSVNAILAANPKVDPNRLQIGQVVTIPPPTSGGAVADTTASTPDNGSQIYTVRSGDTLTKIANQFGTTIKALRTANNLRTDRIRVGDRLKIPAQPIPPAFTAPGSNAASPEPR